MESKASSPSWSTLPSAQALIVALEAQLKIYSQPAKGDEKLEVETSETVWGWTSGNPVVIFQVVGGNCKEPSWYLGSSKDIKLINKDAASCTRVQAEQFGAQKSITILET